MPPAGWKRPQLIKRLTARAEVVLGNGSIAVVDLEDTKMVSGYSWFRSDSGYAVRSEKPTRMHRLLMGDPPNLIDHKNGNKLDNRRSNLRACTRAQNGHNRRSVGVKKVGNRWRARLVLNGREVHLGYFDTLDEAITARREGELKYYGEFAPKHAAS